MSENIPAWFEVETSAGEVGPSGYKVSKLMVMQSACGFYIGRMGWDPEGYAEPYSRESGYFNNEEEATKALESTKFEVRDCMENDFMYDNGTIPDIRKKW